MVAINLAGQYLGIHKVLISLLFAYDSKKGCLLKIKVKSEIEELTEALKDSIS